MIGSGFWPSQPDTMHETTSFGLWDKKKYPDPAGLVQHFRNENLTVMLGLRITFIAGGPYSDEGVKNGYFLTENGKAKVFHGGWPKLPYYLLDAHNPKRSIGICFAGEEVAGLRNQRLERRFLRVR